MAIEPWTPLGRRMIVDDRFLRLSAERVRTQRGTILDPFYVHEARPWVCIVPVLPDGRLVVVEQYRLGADRVCLELPAGIIDPDEDGAACAARELAEETGYRPLDGTSPESLGSLHPEPSRSRTVAHGYRIRCHAVPGETALEASEDIAVHVMGATELLADPRFIHGTQLGFLMRHLHG